VKVTGQYFSFFSPLIGALGTFVTGSDTSANVLFGKLQVEVSIPVENSPKLRSRIPQPRASGG
jgi:lactate permease